VDRKPLELDVVAQRTDRTELLVGEVKWQESVDWPREIAALRCKATLLPLAAGRKVRLAFWAKRAPRSLPADVACFTPRHVIGALRY
jgi:hypothetical protein